MVFLRASTMQRKSLVRIVAIIGALGIILGALLPMFS
jgi:hypothetical protein